MLFFVCSVVLATGAWNCDPSRPLSLVDAAAIALAGNSEFPYKPGMPRSPLVIWPANEPTPDKRQ